MYGFIAQIAILVAMTQGLRALARVAGPRRCGLLLGLPWSTGLLLLYCGHDRGDVEALATAESGLLGASASAAMPLAYARTVGVDAWRLRAPLSAVAGYVATAAAFRSLPVAGDGAAARVGLAAVGVLAVCRLAGRVRVRDRADGGGPSPGDGAVAGRRLRPLALGALVPAGLVVLVRSARAVGGADWAGLFTTFPGMSLALLVATHLEAGPASACRLARAMPPGNLITIAFLAAFRFVGPRAGLAWGTACGYVTALATLLALEAMFRPAPADPGPPARPRPSGWRVVAPGDGPSRTHGGPSWARSRRARRPWDRATGRGRRRRRGKGFAPRIESLSGRWG